jgi:hypothetical protein
MSCCSANGNQAIYYAWEAITRVRDGVAQVNMMLNRSSPWLDVESWLPYEGKLVLRNKTCDRINVRIPGWIDRSGLRFALDESTVQPSWAGRYAVFDALKPGQVISVLFPVRTETSTLVYNGLNGRTNWRGLEHWECQFRGTTLVQIARPPESPDGAQLEWCRIFRRDHFLRDTAPMREADTYVAPKVVPAELAGI